MDLWRVRSIPFTLLWIAYSRCFVACRACNVCSLISLCSTLLVGPYITFFTFENFPCRCLAELAELPCIVWEVCRSLSVRLQGVQEKCVDMFGKSLARVCSIHTYSHQFDPFIAQGDPTGISEVHHAGNCCMSSLERERMNVLHCFTNFRIMKCSVQLSVKSSRLSTAQIALSGSVYCQLVTQTALPC